MDVLHPEPQTLTGSVRRFGPIGPIYEILGPANPDEKGQPQMAILVIESGERLDYPVSDILEDPRED